MLRHVARLASVLAGATASILLVAAPAGAEPSQPPVPVALPPILECLTPWTNVIVGTAQNDDLVGTDANDLIIGLGGNDNIYGAEGRDTILGGNGNDVMGGGPDDDCIIGGAGDDESVLWVFSVENGNDDSYSVAFRYQY
jgi:Ca2+-binding RTX toxin-like protein